MKVAIIAAAGISARFNKDISETEKKLKVIFYDDNPRETLLYNLVDKCSYADRIVIVGGYKFEELNDYLNDDGIISPDIRNKITLVKNIHYEDLASGYSFYLGLCEAYGLQKTDNKNCIFGVPEEILFVEGDLDVDGYSFEKIKESKLSVLSYNHESIYANKAVVLYRNEEGRYKYAFNSSHGLLRIEEAFSVILNSGQIWKFKECEALKKATILFGEGNKDGTNLEIIQNYLDRVDYNEIELLPIERWTNCNTREDYRMIKKYWENDNTGR